MRYLLKRYVYSVVIIVFLMIGLNPTHAQIVNDPLFDQQGYLETANIPDAWSFTTGDPDQTIAIVGGGNVLPTHEDLGGKTQVQTRGFVDSPAKPPIPFSDQPPFATAAAGMAAAITNNQKGIAGVNWNASILSYNPAIIETESGFEIFRFDPTQAANQLSQSIQDGADLTIASFTYFKDSPDVEFEYQIGNETTDILGVEVPMWLLGLGELTIGIIRDLVAADSVLSDMLGAIGNAAQNDHLIVAPSGDFLGIGSGLPAASSRYKGAISVGATDEENVPSEFSGSSISSNPSGATLDLVAPGKNVMTTLNTGDSSYGEITTTNASAGLVGGVSSLLQSYNEDLTAEDIRQVLRRTARDIETPGFDAQTGFGALDAEAALQYVDNRTITQGIATNGAATLEEENFQLTATRVPIWGEVAPGTFFADRYRVEFVVDLPEGSEHDIWLRPVGTKGWSQADPNNQMPNADFEVDPSEGEATITTWVYDREVCDVLGRCYTTSLPASANDAQVAYTVATKPGSPPPPPPPPLEATLSGPTYVDSGQSGTWTANVEGGEGSTSYSWGVQAPGSTNWTQKFCSGDSCSHTFSNFDNYVQDGEIRVTVTKGSETETASQIVTVSPGASGCEPGMIICPSALASQVSSFEAEPQGEAAQLAWTTTGSMGEGAFLVQHRADSTAAWSDLQTVEVAERTQVDSTDAPTYQLETDALAPGTHQFRLQWAAGGETALLADVVEAEITLEDPYRLRAYPNPAGAQMTVEGAVKERQHVRVQIYDVLGRRVTTVYDGPMAPNEVKRFTVQPGTEGLSSGTYFLRMTGEQFQTTTRISVVR